MSTKETLQGYKERLEAYLNALPLFGAPDKLKQAMRYSLLGGGKRLRVKTLDKRKEDPFGEKATVL